MAGPTTIARFHWAVGRAPSLPETCFDHRPIVHGHLGLVDAWRLMLVCVVANAGAEEFLGTLTALIMCGLLTGL